MAEDWYWLLTLVFQLSPFYKQYCIPHSCDTRANSEASLWRSWRRRSSWVCCPFPRAPLTLPLSQLQQLKYKIGCETASNLSEIRFVKLIYWSDFFLTLSVHVGGRLNLYTVHFQMAWQLHPKYMPFPCYQAEISHKEW